MALDYATFIVSFPEFSDPSLTALVTAKLAETLLEIDANVWRAKANTGQAYLTAHRLATSPYGQNARLVTKEGSSTYEREFKKLVLQVANGYRVI